MKTLDEIKKGLGCFVKGKFPGRDCSDCPYLERPSEREWQCPWEQIVSDALAYIQQLEEDRKERDILADAYQELEAAQPKWISVEERLPEPFVSVLVHIPEEEPLPQVHEGYITPDGTWCSVLYVATYDRVAHWMPLPEPPKEENDGKP